MPVANAVPVCLLSFASCTVSLSLLSSCSLRSFFSFPQMLHSSTSSTVRQHRTLRSCARLALMSSLCVRTTLPLLLFQLRPADLFLSYLQSHTPTPCSTQAPSPVLKACLSLSPPRMMAGLRLHVYPSHSHSRPHCGESYQGSGTVLS